MAYYSGSTSYSELKRLPKKELLEIAQDLAKKCDVELIATFKAELASFICYYGMLP